MNNCIQTMVLTLAGAICLACVSPVSAQSASQRQAVGRQADAAVADAVRFLLSKVGPDGNVAGELPAANRMHGGKTALAAYALLSAGVAPSESSMARMLKWLISANLSGTHAVSMRACALALVREPNCTDVLSADIRWLTNACSAGGGFTQGSLDANAVESPDNSSSQLALMAISAGASRGIEVKPEFWRMAERYWLDQQQADGGWGYWTRDSMPKAKTYGSATAAGLASLYLCFDNVRRGDILQARQPAYKPIDDGLAWLDRNFKAAENPGVGANWLYQWLYAVSRVGLASGRRTFGGQDWFAAGAGELLARQNDDGSWGYGDRITETSLSLLFLARGRGPVLFHKLQYSGQWNSRPRDLAAMTDWLSGNFERPLNWQVLDAQAPLEDWRESPILYISGAGLADFSEEQIQKMRAFVLQGGTILSEAAGNSADFNIDMERVYRRLFPQYQLVRLADDHPVYRWNYTPKVRPGLMGVSNGIRLLAIHAPQELSLALQAGPAEQYLPWFELVANIEFFLTEKGFVRTRLDRAWPVEANYARAATVRVARIKYQGNYDPEPLAWTRLALHLAGERRIRLQLTPHVEIANLDSAACPLAAMTGTGAFQLSPEQLAAVGKYLRDGGTLLIDAGGGSREFAACVEKQILPLAGSEVGPIVESHAIYHRPVQIDRVNYRREFATALGAASHQPRLVGAQLDGRLCIVFSPDDLMAAVLGYGDQGIRGYTQQTAVRLLANIICNAAKTDLPAGK